MNNIEQRSPEWFAMRAGKITASRVKDVMTNGRGGKPSLTRLAYLRQVVAELHTGTEKASFRAKATDWGTESEPLNLGAYEAYSGEFVTPAGFIAHPDYPFIGASPDFLVGEDGGGEMKCPYSQDVHLGTLLDGMPDEHMPQVQCGLWVTGRKWWDFTSFHPDFQPHTQLYVKRVYRDEEFIKQMEVACLQFWAEVQASLKSLETFRQEKSA